MPARLGGLRHGGTPGLADAFFPARRRLAISPAFAEELAFHAHVHLLNSRASPIGARRTGSRLPLPHFAAATEKGPRTIPITPISQLPGRKRSANDVSSGARSSAG